MEIVSAVVGSLVSKIAELSAEPVIKQFSYMFCFNNFVKEFSEQWRSLALARRRVQHAVDVAIRNAEEIDTDVNKWLEDAKKALAVYGLQDAVDVATKNAEEIEIDVNKWLEDAKNKMEGENRLENEKGKNGKCFTWCPKWICQFKLSKALEKKTETLRKLEEESKKFQKVGHKVPPQDLAFLPSKDIIPSESSKEAFEQIMKALKDDNVNMIGLHGMGGVGKTTLVQEVGRRAKESQLFDVVLLATVSQNPNVMDIQNRIADRLRLQFDVKTKEGGADLLWESLKTVKKLLVILDDVWQDVDLKEIGIPVGDAHKGCKVLLTTRDRDICSSMECQPLVFLSILSENEAWALFKINAGLRDEDSNLNRVAEKVARECRGLPIALVTVGRALRGKSVDGWEVASTKLKNSQLQHLERNGEQKSAYGCLKLSYDYLKHEETKLCFLLCCLFPEDYSIPMEDLTRYAVGYGIHQDVESIEDARKQVYVEIKTLKDCCMLLGTETEESVKMHDLVRDVAIQIASKEHGFMVKAGVGLKEWPRNTKSFEGCTTISLMGNKLTDLPDGLVCPQLKVLLLELDYNLNVPARFFEGMKEIEVLSLKGGCLSLQSLEFSTNLQSLLLIECKCNDLIWLRKLQRLEILGFIECSSVRELPDEIGELKELRLLDVTCCRSLGRIPVNLIGRLKKLEELLIGGHSFKGWDAVGCDSIEGTNAGLTELNSLSHLAVLSLKIPRVECIPRDFVFPRLLRYEIVLGDWYLATEYPTSTRLYLYDISAASLNAKTFEQLFPTVSQIAFRKVEGLESIALSCDQMTSHGHGSQKDFLQRLEDVKVKGCRDTRTLFPAKWRQALNNLTSVEIGDCESLEEVFELGEAGEGINEEKELWLLSSLTRLELKWLPELKCIWKGPTRHVSLQSLVHLELQGLNKLTFIFTPHLTQSLVHLESLRIENCSGLKHLIGEKDDEREIIPESVGFPKLKTLFISGCDKLEYVFPVSVSPSLLNLEEMEIEFGDNLKHIFYSGEGDALTRDGIINFPQLRELSLSRCDFFGPKHFTAQLPSLQVLSIDGHEELGDLLAQLQGHTNLRKIRITHCKGEDRRTGHELSLEEEGKKFQKVAHKAPLQDIEFLPSKEFTPSESSKEAYEQIMKALKDDKVNMIGLYGRGGVGKTTLVKEVGEKAKESQLFDEVLMVTLSQNPNVMSMQDRMADNLGLKLDEKTTKRRAGRLWQRLKTVKKLLVILDDVWQDVELKEIGIPFGDNHRGCKVLLATRLGGICSLMQCQQNVFLSTLSENEAWALFKIKAGLRDEDSNLNTVAKEVARECQGLPIALVTVGRALRGKSVDEWEFASTKLKNSQLVHMERIGEQKNAYDACLKLSYDYLKHEETKLCFLLCCLFPEDYDISIEDLTRYAVGYGIHQDVESIEDARKQVYVEIKTLKDCCMLLGTDTEESVKMHDLVRDVAIQIASKEHGFMVKAGVGLKEWPRSTKSFEGCTTISLMGNKLTDLPDGLVCPQLKVLLLELDYNLNVPARFFEGMKEIEVLSLKGGCLSLQSLEFSTNLQSLLLIECKCNDLIWLRKLQRLEILGFIECSSVRELPDEIGELKELRLLDVTGCRSLGRIPVNLIGRLKKLEELLIGGHSFKGWDAVGCDSIEGTNAGLTELNSLSHLAVLSLKIPRVECIPRDFVFPRLLRYDILLGNGYLTTEYPTSKRLYLNGISAASLNAKTFEQLFPTVSQIGFIDVEGLENIALSCDQMTSHGHGSQKDFFQRLEDVEVSGCKDIRTLFPAKWRLALNNLTSVEIFGCESLEEVFELGEAGEGINLETLHIQHCGELKHLIREKDDEREIIPESLRFLKLKTLLISGCDKLEYVFPVSVSPILPNLEEMTISFCANLKQIFYSGEGDALTRDGIINFPQQRKLSLSRPTNFTVQLPSLQVLDIEGNEELGDFLAQLQGHTNLRKIRIRDCKGAQDRRTGHELSLLSMEELRLWSMPDMRCIWKGLVLSRLTSLYVYDCQKLTHVFTGSMVASLVQLQYLRIEDCLELEQIIAKDNDDEKDQILSGSDLQSLCFPRLCRVKIYRCNKLRRLFPVAMVASLVQLEKIVIYGCSELEQIIAKDNDDEKDQILSGSDLQSLCFPNLCEVKIIACNKLRSLFPVAMAAGLPNLEKLQVADSCELLGLFWQDDDASPVNVEKQMVLPNLYSLRLENLPSIVCYSLGCDDFLFSCLEDLTVDECPKLTAQFARKIYGSTSAQSEVSQSS